MARADVTADFARGGPQPMLRPEAAGQADLGEIVAILTRRAVLIGLIALATTTLAVAYLLVARPLYSASTALLVDARNRPPIGSEAQPTNNAPDAALVESQVKLISSDTVLRRVVDSEKLDADIEFAPTTPGLRTRLFALVGLAKIDSGPADMKLRALESLQRAVTVKRSERTYVIDVEVATREADKSARIANAIARAYVADLQAANDAYAARSAEWLRTRIAELQQRVQEAERRAQSFREANDLVSANGKSVNEQDLADLSQQLTEARAKASEARARYEQIRRMTANGRTPEGVGEGLKSGVIERLRQQQAEIVRQEANYRMTLGPRHPAFIEVRQQLAETNRLIQEEARRLVEVAASEHQSARAHEAALARRLGEAKGQTATDGKALVQLRELEREVEASRIVYEKFLRARETVKEDTFETPLARMISPAVAPQAPSSPKKLAILSMALAGGLGLGVGAALGVDYLASGGKPPSRAPAVRATPTRRRRIAEDPDVIGRFALADARAPGWRARFMRRRAPEDGASAEAARVLDEARGDPPARSLHVARLEAEGAESRSQLTLLLARAAARRGERVLIIASAAATGPLAPAPEATPARIDCFGSDRIAWPLAGADAGILVMAPQASRDVERDDATTASRSSGSLRARFDLVLFDGPDGRGDLAAEVCGAAERTLLLASPEEDAAALDQAVRFIDAAGGLFVGAALDRADPGVAKAA
ncbi:MAG: GumC family protein [Methylobacteriaceae bacterium]|nr:GumC family protein [Methylobacteriaceae bacterium]